MRTAVFDLDGTLADTAADLIAAANAALVFGGHNVRLDPIGDAGTAFHGGRAMLSKAFGRMTSAPGDGEVDRLYPVLLQAYGDRIDRETRVYDGVGDALDQLERAGWLLAVCTNKPVGLAETLLDRLGLAERFEAVLGADSLAVRKPDPLHLLETISRAGGTAEKSVLVGDTVTDREAARRAEVACVLVAFGPEGEAVARLEPEAILQHYDELPGLLEQMIPPQ